MEALCPPLAGQGSWKRFAPSPACGGGPGWGPARKPTQDYLAHALRIPQHLVVPEPQNTKTATAQKRIAPRIARRIGVLSAVDFHDQPGLQAGEVDDVRADGQLPPEPESLQLAHAQAAPQRAFGIGHPAPQLAGAIALLAFAHPCAPRWGRDQDGGGGGGRLSGKCFVLFGSWTASLRVAPTPALPRKRGREKSRRVDERKPRAARACRSLPRSRKQEPRKRSLLRLQEEGHGSAIAPSPACGSRVNGITFAPSPHLQEQGPWKHFCSFPRLRKRGP